MRRVRLVVTGVLLILLVKLRGRQSRASPGKWTRSHDAECSAGAATSRDECLGFKTQFDASCDLIASSEWLYVTGPNQIENMKYLAYESFADANFECDRAQLPLCYEGPGIPCGKDLWPTSVVELGTNAGNAGVGGTACFPGSSMVLTTDGPRTMSQLQEMGSATIDTSTDSQTLRWDRWLWDVHASMGSDQAKVHAEFLSITHSASSRPLRISAEHWLFMTKNEEAPQMLPARDLAVGNTVFSRSPTKSGVLVPSTVTSIDIVMDTGIYAPFTWSGRLMVDDVLVSNYAIFSQTFQDTHDQHAWLPWERLMNLFNPFRYFYGSNLAASMLEMKYPAWMEAQGTVGHWVTLVWRLADTFIVYPLGLFARAVELAKWAESKERADFVCDGK